MNKKTPKNKKVFVGLSGGVDSSVSAYLLKKQGYQVTGVFIKAWHPDFLPCNWKNEMRDAMRVCAKLDIPFLLCDLSKEYKKEIIDYLIDEYKNGHTPNPDVLCNKKIKFGYFLKWAKNKGADFVATGHYATNNLVNNEVGLFNSHDHDKDQTYFLWTLEQEQISKILFPIGHLKKKEVRKIAAQIGLNTATKKDSQGLCFLGHVNMKSFLRRYIETKSGDILNIKGEIIGKHDGSELYTIGERHGFTIFNNEKDNENQYVLSKDIDNNTITVSEKTVSPIEYTRSDKLKNHDNKLIISKIRLNQVSFVRKKKCEGLSTASLEIDFKIRYRGDLHPGILSLENGNFEDENCENRNHENREIENRKYEINTKSPIERIAKGQSIVFYHGNECLGGGIVDELE